MNKRLKIFSGLLLFFFLFNVGVIILVLLFLGPASDTNKDVKFVVSEGSSSMDIASSLEKEGLIKNDKVFLCYLLIFNKKNIYAATYDLNTNMSIREIVKVLDGGGVNSNEIVLTVKEGINMRGLAKLISSETNIKEEEVYDLACDKDYINELSKKYWFISKDVLNNELYYNLEGYLYPDTYNFMSRDVEVREIFDDMIANMDKHLSVYKDSVKKSKYSIHQLLTLASVTQSEGYNTKDFKNVASVFYNRLSSGMAFESCVTSYYGVKKDMTLPLTNSDINAVNAYNTRGDGARVMPAGPVSLPGDDALKATFQPVKTNYYYFVSDKNNKLYFTKSLKEHEKTIAKLKNEGLWLEW